MQTFITAEAEPTKEFFVDMITRDIPVDRAILDLIDNSIDGAHRISDEENFSQLFVDLNISKEKFIIKDNCGGIPENIAETQAFVFGKPKDYKSEKHSIGRFGIGMKRALFKIGKHFKIISHENNFSFKLDIDTDDWVSNKIWDFKLEKIDKEETFGTEIIIDKIHSGIQNDFELQYFTDELIKEVSKTHSLIIQKGFKIIINGKEVSHESFLLKQSEYLIPEVISLVHKVDNKEVNIKIYSGVSDRDINKGGWYIFCNDRLILDADKSSITGWKYDELPKYHPDFAFFRGYVTFDSDDADLLPWTTTKTGLNSDSELYKIVFFEMKKVMKKVISFLRSRAEEDSRFNKGIISSNPMSQLIENAPSITFLKIIKEMQFSYSSDTPEELELRHVRRRIQYSKLQDELEFLKEYIGVSTNKDVGIYTFDYFLELARSENE